MVNTDEQNGGERAYWTELMRCLSDGREVLTNKNLRDSYCWTFKVKSGISLVLTLGFRRQPVNPQGIVVTMGETGETGVPRVPRVPKEDRGRYGC